MCGRDDSQPFEVTKSVRPASTVVCEAKAADSIEIFSLKKVGLEGRNPSSFHRASNEGKSQ